LDAQMKLNAIQSEGLKRCMAAAIVAGHPFPGIAAAEAAVETATKAGGWFTSTLYTKHNNYLGLKAPSWYKGAVVALPTDEFVPDGKARDPRWANPRNPRKVAGGTWWTIDADFCHFNTLEDCARCQMIVLGKAYADCLAIEDPQQFAQQVSHKWSTGQQRGDTVVAIYRSHADLLAPKMEVA
jgi:hypothetical protein